MSSGGKGRTGSGGKTSGNGSGMRKLAIRLKTAKGRTTSSQLWLARQLNDPYVAQARQDGYRSRAVYKLLQINERYKIFKPGQRVIQREPQRLFASLVKAVTLPRPKRQCASSGSPRSVTSGICAVALRRVFT